MKQLLAPFFGVTGSFAAGLARTWSVSARRRLTNNRPNHLTRHHLSFSGFPASDPKLAGANTVCQGGAILAINMAPETDRTGKAGVIVAPEDASPVDKLVRSRKPSRRRSLGRGFRWTR